MRDPIDTIFGELRSLFQQVPDADVWDRVCMHASAAFSERTSEAERERVEAELFPYVESNLASWPQELRQIRMTSLDDEPVKLRFARCLSVDIRATKKAVREEKRRLEESGALRHLSGVCIDHIGLYIAHPAREFVRLLSPSLERFEIPQLRHELNLKDTPDDQIEMFEWLLDTYSDSLRAIGMNTYGDMRFTRAYFDAVLARSERLRIEEFFTYETYGWPDTHALESLLSSPCFDTLHTFDLRTAYAWSEEMTEFLLEREASSELRRVRIAGISNEDAARLVCAPSLQNVHTWELIPRDVDFYPFQDYAWGSRETPG